jgi:hypothetical protein
VSETSTVSVNQPSGYRFPASFGLTSLSRQLVSYGRPIRRDAAVGAAARVLTQIISSPQDWPSVFPHLSFGQVTLETLKVSAGRRDGLLSYAGEYVDAVNAHLHRTSAVPVAPWLDLRFELQFFDDPADPHLRWTYALLGTESHALEAAWAAVDGVEAYPAASLADPPTDPDVDPGWSDRRLVWDRLTAPFRRSLPLSWRAPDPSLLFDLAESMADPGRDDELAASGGVTQSLVMEALGELLGDSAPADLLAMVTRPVDPHQSLLQGQLS